MKRIPSLSGLRAVSVIAVTASHYLPFLLPPGLAWYAKALGAPGVDVFFVISGFLITTLLFKEWDDTGKVSLSNFYLRRSLRILPAYIFFLLFVFTLSHWGKLPVDSRSWPYLLTYTYNFKHHLGAESVGQVWSLCVEEHFYFLWPPLLIALGLKKSRRFLFACLPLSIVLRFLLSSSPGFIDIDYFTFTRLDTIAIGCLLAFAFRTSWIRKIRGEKLGVSAGLLFFLSVFVLSNSGKYSLGPKRLVEGTLVAVIISCFAQDATGPIGKLLNARLMTWIGKLSYSIYLGQTLASASFISIPFRVPAMIAYACISYYFIELPFLRLKDRLASRELAEPNPIASSAEGEFVQAR